MNEEYILCPICGKKMKCMTTFHTRMHGMSVSEFKIMYPDFNMTCGLLKQIKVNLCKDMNIENINNSKWRDAISKGVLKYYEEPKNRDLASERFKQLWQDPNYVEAQQNGMRTAVYDNDDIKKRISMCMRRNWKDSDYRKNFSMKMSEYYKDPEFYNFIKKR